MATLSHQSLGSINELSDAGQPNEIFCSACRLKFSGAEGDLTAYKLHLTTEFHVYNARRKTADLAPISQALFDQKRRELISVASSEQSEHSYYCKDCRRAFNSAETLEQHLKSKKHKKNVKNKKPRNSYSTDDGASIQNKVSESNSDHNPFDEVDKTLTEDSKMEESRKTSMDSLRICLFCNKASEGVKKNLDHMRSQHSFYILDIDCLISLKALLHYLAEKIHVGLCCINCNKTFQDMLSVQNHMKDMCHCSMNSEYFDDEYEYFYDFAATYEEQFVGKKLEDFDLTEEPLAKPLSEKIFSQVRDDPKEDDLEMVAEPMEDIEEDDGDDDWEDVDVEDGEEIKEAAESSSFQHISAGSDSSFTLVDKTKSGEPTNSVSKEETKSMAEQSNLSEAEVTKLLERRKKNRFDYQQVTDAYKQAIVLETGEIQLGSGRILGHRQWAREYNQRVPLRDIKEAQVIKKLGIEYKKLGNETAIQKSFNHQAIINRDMKKFNLDKKMHKHKKAMLKLGVKNNKVKTTYFREQML